MEQFKIVIIDDEKETCLLMKRALERVGLYSVFLAYNGAEGEMICTREKPDLIFLDYVLPNETGDKIIFFLKSNPETANIPVVLMSGLGEMSYSEGEERWKWVPNREIVFNRGEIPDALKWRKASEEVARELGVTVYLRKPFSKDTLLHITSAILGTKAEER